MSASATDTRVTAWRRLAPDAAPRGVSPHAALVISSLGAGGAERVMSMMANHWAERGWRVTLITLDVVSGDFFALHPGVERVGIDALGESVGAWEALRSNARRIARLRSAIRTARPDVVIGFTAPMTVLAIIAARAAGVPVIVSERIDPTRHTLPAPWPALRRLLYPRAAAVVVQTPEVRQWTLPFLRPERVHVIPNPVVRSDSDEWRARVGLTMAPGDRAVRQVVAMGRLDPQKGFDVLIRAFAACPARRPDWRLTILGEGPEREGLQTLARTLGVAEVLSLPGRVAAPAAVLRHAELFVLSSRYEGFPNALAEAMADGLPVIATDCPSGPSLIVRHNVDGVLVPPENVAALADAMAALMQDPARRSALGARAREVTERFSLDRVMATWETVVRHVVGVTPAPRHR